MIAIALMAALATAEPSGSVDVTVHRDPTPPNCSLIDAAYFGCSLARSSATQKREALKKKVGALIADNKCDDAYKMALTAGDFDLAKQVRGLCTPQLAPAP